MVSKRLGSYRPFRKLIADRIERWQLAKENVERDFGCRYHGGLLKYSDFFAGIDLCWSLIGAVAHEEAVATMVESRFAVQLTRE